LAAYYARRWTPHDAREDADLGLEVVVWDQVFAEVQRHTATDLENEVAGFLLGSTVETAAGTPAVVVEASLSAKHVRSGATHAEFTHDTWTTFHEEREARYGGMRIVGWYHTHPNIGLFLSKYDTFIHENFFKDDDRIALVVDPVQGTSSFFKRVDGKLDPFHSFGFTELSSSATASLQPGRNLQLANEVPIERSGLPAEVYAAQRELTSASPPSEDAEPGLRDLIDLVSRVARWYWQSPTVSWAVRAAIAWLLSRPVERFQPAPSTDAKASGPRSKDTPLVREDREAQRRSEAAASVGAVSAFKRILANRIADIASELGTVAAWTIIGTAVALALAGALLVALVPPISGEASSALRWVLSSLAAVMAVGGLVASTASLLGPLSAGLAGRLSDRIASRIEIRLLRALGLGS
jgi:proteasome lid subunit RPN8/RPN11